MTRRISVNIGFITNSSSCIYHFPKAVLEDESVQTFLRAHEMHGGYVGNDLWHRARCGSFLVTEEQKQSAQNILGGSEDPDDYCRSVEAKAAIDPKGDDVYIIYGDEYHDETHILCGLLTKAAARLNLGGGYITDYN